MMMHSCIKNSRVTFDPHDFTMTLFAREFIPSGTSVTHSYVRPFNPTNLRRLMLCAGKHFSCECERCVDPTEKGSYASAWRCRKCKESSSEAFVVPELPLDLASMWKCESCGDQTEGLRVAAEERAISQEISSVDNGDIGSLEAFCSKYSSLLHPNHGLLVDAKQKLTVAYGRSNPGGLESNDLERKIELCREVLKVTKILETGISTRKGASRGKFV